LSRDGGKDEGKEALRGTPGVVDLDENDPMAPIPPGIPKPIAPNSAGEECDPPGKEGRRPGCDAARFRPPLLFVLMPRLLAVFGGRTLAVKRIGGAGTGGCADGEIDEGGADGGVVDGGRDGTGDDEIGVGGNADLCRL
jgi:hypothetical protein